MNLGYTGECPNKTAQNYIKFIKKFSGVIFRMSGDLHGDGKIRAQTIEVLTMVFNYRTWDTAMFCSD